MHAVVSLYADTRLPYAWGLWFVVLFLFTQCAALRRRSWVAMVCFRAQDRYV